MSVSYGGDSITFADSSTISSGYTGFKNRIINGSMIVDQRAAGANTATAGAKYHIDRWYMDEACDAVIQIRQVTNSNTSATNYEADAAPTSAGFRYALKLAVSTADTSVVSGQYALLGHMIEGCNIQDLAWGTADAAPVTLSFWVKSNLTGTYSVTLRGYGVNYTYAKNYTINVANTWEKKTITIPGPTQGTWKTNFADFGINILFSLGNATDAPTASVDGQWNAFNTHGVTGGMVSQWTGTVNNNFYLTGVQLERGSVATSFEHRSFNQELLMCMRYYQNSFYYLNQPGVSTSLLDSQHVMSWSDGNCMGTIFQIPMMGAPTITLRAQGGTTTGYVNSAGTDRVATATNIGSKSVSYISVTSGSATNYVRYTWEASAEL